MKRPIIVCVLCVLCAAAVLVIGYNTPQAASDTPVIPLVLLTENDTGSFLLQLRRGAQTAATASGARLSVAVISQGSIAEQLAALRGTTEGVLLLCDDAALARGVTEECERLELPLFTVAGRQEGFPGVQEDNEQAGRMAAQWLTDAGCSDALFIYDDSEAAVQRLVGVGTVWSQGESLCWRAGEELSGEVYDAALARRATLVALDDGSSYRLAELRRNGLLPVDVRIVGTDPGTDRAVYLEQGILSALILPDPYAMGYAGTIAFLRQLQGGEAAGQTLLAPVLVTRQNLYNAETVRCVFPLL